MCYKKKQTKTALEFEDRFKAKFIEEAGYEMRAEVNGFDHPFSPVITNLEPEKIQMFRWGLIPTWAKDKSIQNSTLNAKIETIHEKPLFKNNVQKRCLVLADGFYEWKHLDPKGKRTKKYLISLQDDEAFAFAGLFSEWLDPGIGKLIHSYTILTTEANELMSEIHNSKKRMPVIIKNDFEADWLKSGEIVLQHDLIATSLEAPKIDLFSGF